MGVRIDIELLLEREAELSGLGEMVELARGGAGRAALIEGEAGIGKTALLVQACQRGAAAGMTVLTARGGELEREFAWGAVRQLFDRHLASFSGRRRDEIFADSAGLALPALGLEGAPPAAEASFSTLHGLYWLTVNLAQRGPVVLAIDDLHWADRPSLRYVLHLAPRLGDLPILLVATARPVGSQPAADAGLLSRVATQPAFEAVRPGPLSEGACEELVRDRLSPEADAEFCAACYEMTRGNPFLVGALIDALESDGTKPSAAGAAHVRRMTPDVVSRSVLVALAALPAGALSLARAIAVLGAQAEFRRARRLARLQRDEAAAIARSLTSARIIRGEAVVEFVHPLVRAAVYADLSGAERSSWHERAVELLVTDGAALEELTPHLLSSLPDGNQQTVERLRDAAAQARAQGAPESAVHYLRRALAEPPVADTRASLLFELGAVDMMQDPTSALPALTEAFAGGVSGVPRATVALVLGEALTLCGRLAEAVSVFASGLGELGGDRSDLRADLEAGLLAAARWESSAQAERHRTLADIRRRATAREQLAPVLHSQLAIEVTAEGADRDTAIHHARETLAAADQLTTSASAVPEAALVLTFADLADEGWRAIEARLALAQRRGWPLGVGMAATCASLTALYRGSIGEAIASARGAMTPGSEIRLAPVTLGFLVEALIERGEIELALSEIADRGLDGDLARAWATTPLLLARGRLHAAAGDHRRAITDLRATGERADAWGVRNPAMMPWRSSLAGSLAAVGERGEAIRIATEEVKLALRWGTSRAIGIARRAAGIARGDKDGLTALRAAVAVLEDSPAQLEHARALTDLGSVLRRRGERAEAREPLRRGLDLAQRCGAIALADRARDELIVAGARPRRDALRGRDSLTTSELRVAELAAQGRTNNQIAQALFVTPRTVETHLTSSYSKLGISSRRDLPDALETQVGGRPPARAPADRP
ncbi:MAG: helix-turn-helix transcriptional regulator [Solirubrobacteraceae bacterium]